MIHRATPMAALAVALVASPTLGDAQPAKPGKVKAVEARDWGRAVGHVYDAESRAPIEGADVVVQQGGEFASEGKTVGKTDVTGLYRCAARLGRVSDNLDVGRLLNTGIIGLLGGGAKKVTKRVDVTRLNLRVARDGYHPFEGVVHARSVDATSFVLRMEPILLTEASSPEVSTAADGWGAVRVLEVTVEPPILRPGSSAEVIARLECPPLAKPASMKVQSACRVFGSKQLTPASEGERDAGASAPEDGAPLRTSRRASLPQTMLWRGEFTVRKARKARTERLTAFVTECPYDVAAGCGSAGALVQVVTNEDEEAAARLRLEAERLQKADDNVRALAKLKELCERPDATVDDYRSLAKLSQTVHEYDTAASAMQHVVEVAPKDEHMRAVADYAQVLLLSGQPKRVLDEAEPEVAAIKEKARPRKVPLSLMAAIGTAYVQTGDLDAAEDLNAQLTKLWGMRPRGASTDPALSDFRRRLRAARVEAAVAASPNDAKAWADYGRVLLDQGRWEEGAEKLRKALELDPALPAVQWDLGYALLHVHGEDQAAQQSFEQALEAAEQQVHAPGKKAATKDFFAWHRLAILLYRKACEQRRAGEREEAATLQRCKDALIEALRCARAGARVSEGYYSYMFGYMSPKVVAISGFAYAEANDDYLLYDSLTALDKHPDDYLSEFSLATALIDLGQVDLAGEELDKCQQLRPDFPEAKYARALIAMQKDDSATAADELREVLESDPRHPQANLKLAELYAAEGDMAAAAACLAAHAQYYPGAQ